MPRKLRIEYPGAIYHVMSRGDRREAIFHDDADHFDFLKTLAEACLKTSWQIHAYCLMGNHYHMVVETPEANLVAGMRWLQSTYTIRLNHRQVAFFGNAEERDDRTASVDADPTDSEGREQRPRPATAPETKPQTMRRTLRTGPLYWIE